MTTNIKLLFEDVSPSVANVVCESTKSPTGETTMWLNGVFMQSGIENRNKRTYPQDIMERAVQSAMQTIQENGGIFGELDHPQTLQINMDRISHAIMELRLHGNDVYGKAKLLKTPMGLIAEELGRSGVRYGISSRGAGDVMESTGQVTSYSFVTADLVAVPSAPGAYPKPIYESLVQSREGNRVLTLAEHLQHDASAQKYFKKEIMSFLTNVFDK